LVPVSERAEAAWTDTEGLPGVVPFPEVDIEVLFQTATPTFTPTPTFTLTPTATSTPTATPTPAPQYLPILFRSWPEPTPTPVPTECIPEEQTVDVALVIDTSTSMSDPTQAGGQPKLQAAIGAAQELVNLLKPEDQTAVIGFNRNVTVATELTGDRARIVNALQSLPATQAEGTWIDLGLQAGLAELTGPRHKSENNRSIVLVTDGRQTNPGGPQAVRDAAQAIKDAGIRLITVGLGSDVDEQLLREIASRPEDFFRAPNAEDLLNIYRDIANYIPCP
jgi:hypothetical protein